MSRLILAEVAAPSTPAASKVALYAKADGLLYWKDDAGTEYSLIAAVAASIAGNLTFAGTITLSSLLTTNGQIKFPGAHNPSADVNTLDDYEEGTYTPNDQSGAGLTFTSVTGAYVKIGRYVFASSGFTYPSTANGLTAVIGGLPFTIQNVIPSSGGMINYCEESTVAQISPGANTTNWQPRLAGGGGMINSAFSLDIMRTSISYISSS